MRGARDNATAVGLGAVACVACCAAPIIGVLTAIGLTTALGVALFGVVGLAVAALAIMPVLRRRRAARSCTVPAGDQGIAVPLDAPTRRSPSARREAAS